MFRRPILICAGLALVVMFASSSLTAVTFAKVSLAFCAFYLVSDAISRTK
ncbi:hypothetical protein OOJ91_13600 [Micromonospora lupini]|nr:hypothetical protein [Micromonospora lupini]MCX5066881.1 hypothetical protein [Micromonospora lupini]